MMPRKTRRMIIIVSIIVIILTIAIAFFLLYRNTNLFKSSATLFTKYLGQNMENMNSALQKIGTSEFNELLKNNKNTSEMQVKVNYTTNIGTSSESTQNSINQLKLKMSGQADPNNQYKYQDIKLLNNNEKVAEIEYIQRGITHGIRFSDLFDQYILADNENLKELFKKMGYSEEQLVNVPDSIEFNNEVKNIFEFSKDEKQKLKTKYMSIINNNVSKENFSKQKSQMVEIEGKSIKANSYVLTITKEQLNNIYIKILEEMKQDETFLSRIDQLQTTLGLDVEIINLRQEFAEELEGIIANITKNNIGKDETKIIVYENNQKTIRTVVQHPDYEIDIDLLSSQTEDYIQISYQNATSEKKRIFTYKKANGETSVNLSNTEKEKTTQYSLVSNNKVEGNHCAKNLVAKYEDSTNRVELITEQELDLVKSFENEVNLSDDNSINLSKLEAEQVQMVLSQVINSISGEMNEINTNVIKTEDLEELGKTTGIIKEYETLEANGITETEKSRFNSQFEILQGEDLESETILDLIEAVRDHLIDLEVVSNTEIKLKLDRLDKNEEVATTLSTFIEENKNKIYNVKVEYDAQTGLASHIVLTMLEK